jgi:pyrroloquinoline-quinone synthase
MRKQVCPTVIDCLDRLTEKYSLLRHPFYKAWTQGTLSRESLKLYAQQYYRHVEAFPLHLELLASRCNGELRDLINENLAEELDEVNPHPALWRQFAAELGVDEPALRAAKPLPGIAALLDSFDELAGFGSKAQAVAAFYVYESQVPEICTQKIAGLKRFYGIENACALAYFAVHEEADIRHRAAWRDWLSKQPASETVDILAAGERAAKALWCALDAVYPNGCSTRVN